MRRRSDDLRTGDALPDRACHNTIAGVGAAVGVAGTVANAVNVWSGQIQAVPDPTARIAGAGVPGVFRLKVSAPGGDLQWPAWIADCARVFQLPTLTPKRAEVEWDVGAQQPAGLIVRGAASGPLDDSGVASLMYETTPETPEQATGRLAVGTVLAVARVRRNDLNDLIEAVANRLFRVLPSFVQQHLGAALRKVVQPLIDTIKDSIGRLKDIETNGLLRVAYHTTEPPKPTNPVPGRSKRPEPARVARTVHAHHPGSRSP